MLQSLSQLLQVGHGVQYELFFLQCGSHSCFRHTLQVFGSSGNSLTLSQILRNFLDQQEVPADQQGFPSDAILVMVNSIVIWQGTFNFLA